MRYKLVSDRYFMKRFWHFQALNRVGIRNSSDYSPFGVELDGRTVSGGYRFGYQGSEKDNEFKGEGNSYTTEFRQLDTRLGRWLSVDPLMAKYPMMSPYVAFNNNPIFFVDPLGLEGTNPGDPPVGSTCIDEVGATLKYEGDGNWSDVTKNIDVKDVRVVSTRDFSINRKKPTFDMDHGHCQDYPEIGYVYKGQREPTAAEKRSELWWNTKAFGATLIRWDLGNALPAYKHFQGATGEDFTFDLDDYFDDDPSATTLYNSAVGIAKNSAEKLASIDGSINMTSKGYAVQYGDRRFPYPQTEDWQKAIGAFNFYMTAKVTAVYVFGKINYTMELTIHAVDRYNFNPGMSDIATGTPDGANGVFEVTGLGKEFMQYGSYTTSITWQK